ncbi:VOC family protein [Roseovarius pelagicus]|uniref:VOC family protein n=1 Tax=Roseovarius pelagicus TaxID=2980108 RepID=A0ABY6DF31_9RHOB|nr:VOC family protein [Roseovarius pelagicus]UXX84757.1 VOC family protein [Roseovarius pelagicus]
MPIVRIYAHLNCSNLAKSLLWYEKLFGRAPDARPMDGLAEWHHGDHAGLQLFQNEKDAGHGTLTLIVDGLRNERGRLNVAGLAPGPVEPATSTSLVKLSDPDGNAVVLAEPGRA